MIFFKSQCNINGNLLMFKRILDMSLPKGQSAFVWGARKTGKSTYLKAHFTHSICYDLLKTDILMRFITSPFLLREEILALPEAKKQLPVIIDEVQKIPALLDEVHWLIENEHIQFILCGSSARKLKRAGANLLGGRAWRYHFYPLLYSEIPEFDLLRALNHGLVPSHYLSSHPQKSLEAYVADYLAEEIQNEGLVQNLPKFAHFLDSMGFNNGEMIVYSNIASDCGVDSKTVQAYFQILVDTLLGYYVLPYHKKVGRDIIVKTPKFYLFDVGVATYLRRITINELKGAEAGHAFEHYIFMELIAYSHFSEKKFEINYWRTKSGLEVDFVLSRGDIAIEVKIHQQVQKIDLKGLLAFIEEHHPKKAIVVSQDPTARLIKLANGNSIMIKPWREFLKDLWAGNIC